jgi:putative spermidine/putrescine transport system permease protein
VSGKIALNAFVALAAAFLVLPILAIVPAAFSAQSFIRLPPDAWSVRWWHTFVDDASWRVTLLASLRVAGLTTLISILAGTTAALGIARSGPRARALFTALFLGPVVTPAIVLAVALYSMARATGLVGTTTALVIAHTTLALPFVVLNVGFRWTDSTAACCWPPQAWAADDFRIFRTVTLPLIAPG